MQEVVKQLSERLVLLGHSVTVATSQNSQRNRTITPGVKIKEFEISGNAVRGYSGNTSEYQQYVQSGDFDVVTNFAAQQWATDLILPILLKIKAKKVFVPTGFSGLRNPIYQQYFKQMPKWMMQYDMNVFLSDTYQDINFAKQHGVTKTTLIPNGAAADEFLPISPLDVRKLLGIPVNHFLIIHVGSHTGEKGHAEAIKMFAKARIPNSTFLLIANNFGGGCTTRCQASSWLFQFNPAQRLTNKALLVRNLTRLQTVAAYQQADLFLFPSNIECSPIVLFECLASKTPFLVTDVGNSREIISWTQAGWLLPTEIWKKGLMRVTIGPSTILLEKLYHDQTARAEMQTSGFWAFEQRFSWEKIALQYESLYKNLVTTA
jgi:glycosyltransferase involved in cell wall biosynthesis